MNQNPLISLSLFLAPNGASRSETLANPGRKRTTTSKLVVGVVVLFGIVSLACGCSENQEISPSDSEKAVSSSKALPDKSIAQQPLSLKPSNKPVIAELHEADRLLSHPKDPNRLAAGAAMEDLIPRVALPIVQQAIAEYPETPRFYYLLGRAYAAAGNDELAMKAYLDASERGYPMAYFNLGSAYAEGTIVELDLAQAEKYLKLALDNKIKIAEASLVYYVFQPEGFSSPELFQAIYDNTLTRENCSDSQLRGYAISFLEPFFQTKDSPDPISRAAYARLAQGAKVQMLGQIFGDIARSRKNNPARGIGGNFEAGVQEGQAITQKLAVQAGQGRSDAQLFYTRHGVESPVAKKFFNNLERYINRLGNASFKDELEKNYTR